VAVVDPGVGTTRRAIVMESTTGKAFVAPDNGLLTVAARDEGVQGIWEITNPAFMRPNASSTFHGRDLFSPAGAVLAAGHTVPSDAGAPIDSIARFMLPAAWVKNNIVFGEVLLLDKSFGNVWTNIQHSDMEGAFGGIPTGLEVSFGEVALTVPLTATFGDVPIGAPLAYINSRGHLAFALNKGDFGERFDISPGTLIAVKEEGP
jgi:S-adenosylmethionine hydrolase